MVPSLKPASVAREPQADETLSPPSGMVFLTDGRRVVSDDFNHRVQVYHPDGSLDFQFGEKGKEPGQLMYPKGVTVDAQGRLYVADSWNHRVQQFDPKGGFLKSFGTYGPGKGQLNEPYDLLVEEDRLVVVERYNHRIQFFHLDGHSLGWLGARATVLEQQLADIYETAYSLQPRPSFEFPTSIARDGSGCFYITDSGNHRILKFDSQWNLVYALGERGSDPGQFNYPGWITVTPGGLVHVADLNNDRIQTFTPEGVPAGSVDQVADGVPCKMPGVIKADGDHRVWVSLTFDPKLYSLDENPESLDSIYDELASDSEVSPLVFFGRGKHRELNGKLEAARQDYLEALNRLSGQNTSNAEWNLLAELPLRLTGLADDTRQQEDTALWKFYEERLSRLRRELLDMEEEWSSLLENLLSRDVERENRVLANQDDPVDFDKEFQEWKKQDKALFLENRRRLHTYRESTLGLSRWLTLRLAPGATSCPQDLINNLCAQFSAVTQALLDLLKKKETTEESLVQGLQNSETDPNAWKTFRIGAMQNTRRLELITQFLVEWTACLGGFHNALLAFPDHTDLRHQLTNLLCREPDALRIPPLLLGLQDDVALPYHVENIWSQLIDDLMLSADDPPPGGPDPVWEVYAYDTEPMLPEGILRNLTVPALPFKQDAEGVVLGGERYSPSQVLIDPEGGLSVLQLILDYQKEYDERMLGLFQTLRDLLLQKSKLGGQINSLDVRDKVAPIQIGRQSLLVTYQVSLLYRMIQTLTLNEQQNQVRLILNSALLKTKTGKETLQPIGTSITRLAETLQTELQAHCRNLKTADLQILSLLGEQAQAQDGMEGQSPDQTQDIQSRLTETQFDYFREQYQVHRVSRLCTHYRRLGNYLEESGATAGESPLQFEFTLGGAGWAEGRFLAPFGIVHSPEGDLWVSDLNKNQVLYFSKDGAFLDRTGQFGNGPGCLNRPYGLTTAADGRLYVADHDNRRIQVFDSQGRAVETLGEEPSLAPEAKPGPIFQVALDASGNPWTADYHQHRILKFTSAGGAPQVVVGPDQVTHPASVVPLADGTFFVSDRSPQGTKRFDAQGNLMAAQNPDAHGPAECTSMCYDPRYGLFISDTYNMRLVLLDHDLKEIWTVFNPGRRAGQFLRLGGISVHENRIALVDFDNHRVLVMTLPDPA